MQNDFLLVDKILDTFKEYLLKAVFTEVSLASVLKVFLCSTRHFVARRLAVGDVGKVGERRSKKGGEGKWEERVWVWDCHPMEGSGRGVLIEIQQMWERRGV